jgi:hypothetical protein
VVYAAAARPYVTGDKGGLFEEPPATTQPFPTPLPPRRPTVTQLAVALGAMLTTMLIAAVVALTTGRSPPPPCAPRLAAAPVRATPLPPRPTTGTLTVAGPAGARVSIGSVAYPPAPCSLELPPGEYDVKLRFKRRALSRHVIVAAGEVSQL